MFMDWFPFLHPQCAGALSAAVGFLSRSIPGLLASAPWHKGTRQVFLFGSSPRISVQLNTFACAARWLAQRFRRMIKSCKMSMKLWKAWWLADGGF
jgi:hypothetical protein